MYANTASAQQVVDRLQAYGVQCDGEVVSSEYHDGVSYDNQMTLGELVRQGGKVSRLRLLTEVWPGRGRMVDISYAHGTLPNGQIVPLYINCETGSMRELKGDLIEWAKREGVYAKGCGLLDESNWSVLY
jgi:hypothetical protein